MKPTFHMKPAKSNNVAEHGYDEKTQTLRIKFHSGAVYDYKGVTPELAAEMEKAKSIGSFMAVSIRNKFKAEMIQAKPK